MRASLLREAVSRTGARTPDPVEARIAARLAALRLAHALSPDGLAAGALDFAHGPETWRLAPGDCLRLRLPGPTRLAAPGARCGPLPPRDRRAVTPGLGHNGGPPHEEPLSSWSGDVWRPAHKRAWKAPLRDIALRRLALAEAAGLSYRAYMLAILERGRRP